MNIFFKRLASLALIASLILALLALPSCHGRTAKREFSVPGELDESRTYEISFWAKNENNESQRNVYAEAVEAFERIYPNIKVTLRNFTDYNDIYKDVINNIATGTVPNVCITYPDHIATYLEGEGTVVSLDSLMTHEKYGLGGSELKFEGVRAEEIIPEFLAEGVINGSQYALPFMRSTEICYVNKTLLESLGFELPETLTWDFILEVSEYAVSLGKTTTKNDRGENVEIYAANGQSTFIPFIYKSTDNMMITMLHQLGAGYSNESGDILVFNDTTQGILTSIASHAASGAFSTFKISGYPANFLNAGQCIFAVDSSAGSTWMGSDAPLIDIAEDALVSFETAVRAVPQYDAEHPQMISQGPSLCLFDTGDDDEILASWLFAQFLLTNDVQNAYAKTEGYIPVTSAAQSSEEYLDYLSREGEDNDMHYSVKIQASRLLAENAENTFTAPVFNGSTSLRQAAGAMIEDVTKAAQRKKTVDGEYVSELFSKMNSLYKLDQRGEGGIARVELGEMPTESKMLLATLAVTWLAMGAYLAVTRLRQHKREKK